MLIWGYNNFGTIGDNTVAYKSSPIQIGAAVWSNADTGIATLGVKTDGTLWSWGANTGGALGINDTVNRSSPVQIGSGTDWDNCFISGYNGSVGTAFAIKKDGTLYGWGEGINGQLGTNTVINYSSPVLVSAETTWKKIQPGYQHSLAFKSDGTVWATGINASGQLGTNNTTNRSSWVQVGNSNQWLDLSVTWHPAIALKGDGTIWVWGVGTLGALGNNAATNISSPIQIGSDKSWSKINAGRLACAAVDNTGRLWVWGNNSYGSLGTNTPLINYSSMVQTTIADTNWYDATLNNLVLMGLRIPPPTGTPSPTPSVTPSPTPSPFPTATTPPLQAQELWGMGLNTSGQFGNNSAVSRSSPVQVNTANYTILPNGGITTGYVRSDGTLWAWGSNQTYGMVGDGTLINRSSPVQIGTENTWSMVAYGSSAAAVKTDGTLWAWGKGLGGSLGQSSTASFSSPVQVGSGTDWVYCATQIFSGSNGAMFAIKKDGSMWACGQGSNGQLAGGNVLSQSSLIQCLPAAIKWQSVYTGNLCTFAITQEGLLYACGAGTNGQLGLGDAVAKNTFVAIGTSNSWIDFSGYSPIGLKGDGTLWGWGSGQNGQLANNLSGATNNFSSPIQIGADKTWVKLASTQSSCAALTNTGNLWVWGTGTLGQLGQGSTVSFSSMVQTIIADANWWDVHGLQDSFLMFRNPNAPSPTPSPSPSPTPSPTPTSAIAQYNWGDNQQHQLGIASVILKSTPTFVLGSTWIDGYPIGGIANGGIKQDGSLWVTGYNARGCLGLGNAVNRSVYTQVGTETNWQTVFLGITSTGTKTDGTLWMWGEGGGGGIGNNSTAQVSSPTQIAADKTWATSVGWLATTAGSTCGGITRNGELWLWGLGSSGQLGQNSIISMSSPVQVGNTNDWSQLAITQAAVMALKTNGTLWGMGSNGATIGINSTIIRSTPVQIGTDSNWTQISGNQINFAGMKSDNTVWVWGSNPSGQLGLGNVVNRSSPTLLTTDGYRIACGSSSLFVLKRDGSLWFTGLGSKGESGTDSVISYSSLVQTTYNDNLWVHIFSGSQTAFSVRNAGGLVTPTLTPSATPTPTPSSTPSPTPSPSPTTQFFYIWGSNQGGQAGNNDSTNFSTSTLWRSSANYKQVAYGGQVIAYIKNDNTLWLAGAQASNVPSLGVGNGNSYSSFVQTSVGGTWKFVAPGDTTTAIKLDGTLWGWGGNYFGQVGNGNSNLGAEVFTPVQIDANTNWVSVYNMFYGGAAINSLGQLYFWGSDGTGWSGGGGIGLTPTQGPTNKSWSQVAMSTYGTTIALATDGSIWTWGQNAYGNCGRNSATGPNFPVGQVGLSTSWVKISSGFIMAYGLKNDGSLWAWGYNGYGELSQNDTVARSSPTQIPGTWLDVVGGPNATWAIKSDGTVWACGGNGYSQQPFTGNKSSLIQVGSITTYTSFPNILSTAYGCIVKGGS